jgi:hypothetical protein
VDGYNIAATKCEYYMYNNIIVYIIIMHIRLLLYMYNIILYRVVLL